MSVGGCSLAGRHDNVSCLTITVIFKLMLLGSAFGEALEVNYFLYYESRKREQKIRCIYECRCDERLQTKTKEFTRLAYTGLVVELEHLKIETRLFIINRQS
jgi:hypothetical protein